ncbi:GATOR2 complex protein MIOS-A-like isoform X3 [Tachypleus tridentatus]|uniref:GATOR2 complex protein MIOS-A-like isoform X3 n=1 Tax=Tachypleus tridentatus TaxID=6853 RepID=UPI003FD0061A
MLVGEDSCETSAAGQMKMVLGVKGLSQVRSFIQFERIVSLDARWALFDVQWCKVNPSTVPPQQVFVSCNFCGKSVISRMQHSGQSQGAYTYGCFNFPVGNKSKMTSCPGCRKPLPRCALCLTNMETPAGVYWNKGSEQILDKVENKLSKFSSWFTWCQTCRHGGYAAHLIEWFKDHTECPVTACSRKCMSLDAVANVANAIDKYT